MANIIYFATILPGLSLISYTNYLCDLHELLNLSVPLLPHMWNRNENNLSHRIVLKINELIDVKCLEELLIYRSMTWVLGTTMNLRKEWGSKPWRSWQWCLPSFVQFQPYVMYYHSDEFYPMESYRLHHLHLVRAERLLGLINI